MKSSSGSAPKFASEMSARELRAECLLARGLCVVGSRVFGEVWVSDFAWLKVEKGASNAPFLLGEIEIDLVVFSAC